MERSLLGGFSGMEIPNINFVWLNCTFPRLYRPLFDLAQLGNHPKQVLPTTFYTWKVTHLRVHFTCVNRFPIRYVLWLLFSILPSLFTAVHPPAPIHSFHFHLLCLASHRALLATYITHSHSGTHPWLPFSFPSWVYIFCTLICIFYTFDLQYFFNMTIKSLFRRLV